MKTKINLFGGFIIAPVKLLGDNMQELNVYFAIDTGSNKTILQPFVVHSLGNIMEKSKVTLTSGSKSDEQVSETVVKNFSVYNFQMPNYLVYIKRLPKKIDYIDGLLGYDFFQELNLKFLLDFENNILSIS